MSTRDFKVILIGDPKAGKTSFVRRYVQGKYDDDYKETIGCDFAMKKIYRSHKELVRIHIWDIGGQDAFRRLSRVFYRSACAAVIMFDITSSDSYKNVVEWKRDVDSNVLLPDGTPVPCLLLANKSDLSGHIVDDDEISAMSKRYNFVRWSKISVKDNLNIEPPMLSLVDEIVARCESQEPFNATGLSPEAKDFTESFNSEFTDSIKLHQGSEARQTSCFCFN